MSVLVKAATVKADISGIRSHWELDGVLDARLQFPRLKRLFKGFKRQRGCSSIVKQHWITQHQVSQLLVWQTGRADEWMWKALFAVGFRGLLRVSEYT